MTKVGLKSAGDGSFDVNKASSIKLKHFVLEENRSFVDMKNDNDYWRLIVREICNYSQDFIIGKLNERKIRFAIKDDGNPEAVCILKNRINEIVNSHLINNYKPEELQDEFEDEHHKILFHKISITETEY